MEVLSRFVFSFSGVSIYIRQYGCVLIFFLGCCPFFLEESDSSLAFSASLRIMMFGGPFSTQLFFCVVEVFVFAEFFFRPKVRKDPRFFSGFFD